MNSTPSSPGEIAQCDLWFPAPAIPVASGDDRAGRQGVGQERVLLVLVMTLAFSRFLTATTAATGGESPS